MIFYIVQVLKDIFMEWKVGLSDIELHNFFGLLGFYQKPEKFLEQKLF